MQQNPNAMRPPMSHTRSQSPPNLPGIYDKCPHPVTSEDLSCGQYMANVFTWECINNHH